MKTEKEKAKLLKVKEKAKANLLKVKEKEKTKLLLKKHIGGDDYVINMKIHMRDYAKYKEPSIYLEKANINKEILHDVVYRPYSTDIEKNIINSLVSSESGNKFEYFWDNIVRLYEIGNFPKIKTAVYEEMRKAVAVDIYDIISSKVFYNCVIIPSDLVIQVETCDDLLELQEKINEHIIHNISSLLRFKQKLYNDKYIIQNISLQCVNGGAHRLKIIITPDDYISFIDPNSSSLIYTGYSAMFDNLYIIYKSLESITFTVSGKDYTISCPQLDSTTNIQAMLSVGDSDRIGACTIISNLIIHVMIHMHVSSLKAINLISTTIVRKFLVNESVEPFADGYLIFLYNMSLCENTKKPLITLPDVKKNIDDYVKTVTLTFKDNSSNIGSFDFVDRVPLDKLADMSPIRKSTEPQVIPKKSFFSRIKLPWRTGTVFNLKEEFNKKTPIYYTSEGLMPFPTAVPLTPEKSSDVPFSIPSLDNLDKDTLLYKKTLLENEINAIKANGNVFINLFINNKIGEILIIKYGIDVLQEFFKHKSIFTSLFNLKKSTPRLLESIGNEYSNFLEKYKEAVEYRIK